MAEFELADVPEFEAIPEGSILEAEVVLVDTVTSPFWVDQNDHSKGKQEQVSFRFLITEPGEYEGRTVFGNTTTTFSNSPNCKLRVWIREILGEDDLPVGFRFNTEALTGMVVKVVIGNYEKKNADDSITVKDKVTDLIRAGGLSFEDEDF